MLTKIELLILKECNKLEKNDIYLIELYNTLKNPPDFKKYYAAIHSLNEKGFFDEYEARLNDTCVTLSTKGYNYKKDTLIRYIKYIVEFILIPVIVGIGSSLITAYLLN